MQPTKTLRLIERILQLRTTVFSWKVLALLLLLPLAVIVLRLTIWRVPVLVTNLLALDAILLMLFMGGLVLAAYGEALLPTIPERQSQSILKWHGVTVERAMALQLAAGQGYCCDYESCTGVRRPATLLLAVLLIILGLFSVIPAGVYDYLRNFSGIAYLGTGNPVPLDSEESYGIYARGALASYAEIGMKMKGYDIILPSRHYPRGGKELALLANDGKELWRGVLVPGGRHRQGDYDFYMEGFVYDLFVGIGTTAGHGLYGSRIRVTPLPTPIDGYSHHSDFESPPDKVSGEVWFDMQTDRMKIRLNHSGKTVETVLGTAGDSAKEVDGYRFNLAGIGRWAHINILRVRHIPLMKAGAAMLLLGLLLKQLFPVRRFKLESNTDGCCTLLTNDGRLLQLVKQKGESL